MAEYRVKLKINISFPSPMISKLLVKLIRCMKVYKTTFLALVSHPLIKTFLQFDKSHAIAWGSYAGLCL